MSRDPKLQEVFPAPPLVAYKVAPNLRSKLVRAKVPSTPAARPRRRIPGMRRCGKSGCPACPYIQPGQTFKAEADSNTCNLVYAISCGVARCRQQYIGQTSKSLKERLQQHLGYVNRNVEATGRHFNLKVTSR